jgi:hypothetical protein
MASCRGAIGREADAHIDQLDRRTAVVIAIAPLQAVDEVGEITSPVSIEHFHRREGGLGRQTDDPQPIQGRCDNPRCVRPVAVVVIVR